MTKEKHYRWLPVLCILLALIGNRFSWLMIDALKTQQFFTALNDSLGGLLNSYFSGDYGLRLSFNIQSIFISFIVGLAPALVVAYKETQKKNYRPKEEHGSARYGTKEEADILKDENEENNWILSENLRLSMNGRYTFMNSNIMTIGGSGAGKTRYQGKPNLLQFNCNAVITDPKGRLLLECGKAYEQQGYEIKIFNMIKMDQSMRYNPLKYMNQPADVFKFLNNLIANTTDQNSKKGGDEFFVKAEIAFLSALIYYILAVGLEEEQNIPMVMDLIDLAESSEEDENAESVLDVMFKLLQDQLKDNAFENMQKRKIYADLAVRQYRLYKKGAGQTTKSILISVGVRMAIFNIPELSNLLADDELDLSSFWQPKTDKNGNQIKTVLFCIISDSDSTFNFLASILYQQMFEKMFAAADSLPNGELPIHTMFFLDEFANIGEIPDFKIKIATMRSRKISVWIMLQNLAQLKTMYKDSWETIFGNCDTTVFLGGKEPSTLKYLSELIGNTTIDYKSISESRGSNGSVSTSNQLINRPLLAADEIGRLKLNECLIHFRGLNVFKDKKYDLMKHPNIDLTTDAKDKKMASQNVFDPIEYLKQKASSNPNIYLLDNEILYFPSSELTAEQN